MKNKIFCFCLIVTIISGCSTFVEEETTPTLKSNATPSIRAYATLTPTALPPPVSPSPTVLLSSTPHSPTALPAVSKETAKNIFTGLLQENGGCRLPCILGLTPGVSEQSDANSFINYFQTNDWNDLINSGISVWSFVENDQGGVDLTFIENNTRVRVGQGFLLEDKVVDRLFLAAEIYQSQEDGSVKKVFGSSYFDDLLSKFTLSQVLSEYGPPAHILIWPFPDYPGHPSPPAQYAFDFILFYPEKGFLIEYIAERTEQDGYFIGCPTKPHRLDIATWSEKNQLSLKEAVQYFSHPDGINDQNTDAFRPIDEVTSLDIKDFYELFKHRGSDECVKTPKELWP